MIELSEDQKDRLHAEEVFRQEVRAKLEENVIQTGKTKVWKQLNQPFTLWAMSTIVVGLVGFAYAQYSEKSQARFERNSLIEQLENQGAIRLEFAMEMLQRGMNEENYSIILNTLLNDTDMLRISPAFKERTTLSIIWELDRIDSEIDYQPLTRTLGEIMILASQLDSVAAKSARDDIFDALNQKIELLTTY